MKLQKLNITKILYIFNFLVYGKPFNPHFSALTPWPHDNLVSIKQLAEDGYQQNYVSCFSLNSLQVQACNCDVSLSYWNTHNAHRHCKNTYSIKTSTYRLSPFWISLWYCWLCLLISIHPISLG